LLALLMLLPALRAFYLQIHEREALRERASRQSSMVEKIVPRRGAILDRNGQPLAISVPVPSIYAVREQVENKQLVTRKLAPILGMKRTALANRLNRGSGFVWLKRRVDPGVAERVERAGIEGVSIRTESRRYYPNGDLAGSVLGFVGTDGGLEGLESSLEEHLRGGNGVRVLNLDARGKAMASSKPWETYPADGATVHLTLDRNIQFFTEQSLREGCVRAGAASGTAIIMETASGKILAMASYPGFNPNDFTRYGQRSFRNRGLTSVYEPGSTFKVVTISAALEDGIFDEMDILFCNNGRFQVADVVINDHAPHGWLTLMGIIRKSSNIGASKVGLKLGQERLSKYVKAFGFGQKSGILLPGEGKGIVRPAKDWTIVDLANISFGQGLGVTPLQLVDAINVIATGGELMRPYLVSRITSSTGEVILQNRPGIVRRVVSGETARKVTRMMETVTETGGSGTQAAIEGFKVAGKTGTAQKFDLEKGSYSGDAFIASFAGFAPSRRPAITAVVIVDEPKKDIYGGVVAAPIWADIVEKTLKYMNIPSLAEENDPGPGNVGGARWAKGPAPASPQDLNLMPDLTGLTLREALSRLGRSGARIRIIGSGIVVTQKPGAGKAIGENVSLKLVPRASG
jgi:cell division protein FtsI (penicillin-binding protein 3)